MGLPKTCLTMTLRLVTNTPFGSEGQSFVVRTIIHNELDQHLELNISHMPGYMCLIENESF